MNDSFLDEVEINHTEGLSNLGRRREQFITTRKSRSAGGLIKSKDLEILKECQENIDTNTNIIDKNELRKKESLYDQKKKFTKELDVKKPAEQERKIKLIETKVLDKKGKVVETKAKSTEAVRLRSEDLKSRHTELKRVSDSRQISNDRSSGSTSSSKASELCSKENVLSDNVTPLRNSSTSKKDGKDSLTLLNAIKDIVSTYSKQESTKILKSMQELHINSQANLIKHLLIQTDDLTKEIHPSRDTSRLKNLVEENERMREDIIILKLRNEELQRKVDESILIKEENIALKLRIKELLKSAS